MTTADSQPLTRAACREYLERTTFRLRSPEYARKYPKWPGSVGLEIEMLPVVPPTTQAVAPGRVRLQGPGESSAEILRAAARQRGWAMTDTRDDHGHPLLLRVELDDADNFSFEPGGQVEFSSKPYPCLGDAVRRMRQMQGVLDELFGAHGFRFVQTGLNPWHTLDEIGLQMPKGRYRAMDRHYKAIGPYGQRMMRQTCTVQMNLDLGSDDDTLARRYLAAQLLSPVAAAMFAYSPVVDREKTGVPGFRTRVWRHTDPGHTGTPGLEILAKRPTRAACIDTFLDFALAATVVFVTELDYRNPVRPTTFAQWLDAPLDGVRPTLDDFITHLTLLFPEVRPRGFIELRSVDCQSRAFQAVPAAWATGLLYDEPTREKVVELLLPHAAEVPALLARAERGLGDTALAALAKQVMALAKSGFAALPSCFKEDGLERALATFGDLYTDQGRTPADDVLDRMANDGTPYITFDGVQSLEERWAKLLKL